MKFFVECPSSGCFGGVEAESFVIREKHRLCAHYPIGPYESYYAGRIGRALFGDHWLCSVEKDGQIGFGLKNEGGIVGAYPPLRA